MDFGARRNALEWRSLLLWACSSAGRAPALQESRQNHTSAASGVAYADSRGAINLLNWTEAGPKSMGGPLCDGYVRRFGASFRVQSAHVRNGIVTRSPTLTLVTPGPIASTIPAPSPPMTE